VSSGSFRRWPVEGVGGAVALELHHSTVAHDAPAVWVFRTVSDARLFPLGQIW
jgi:hypothetical protein